MRVPVWPVICVEWSDAPCIIERPYVGTSERARTMRKNEPWRGIIVLVVGVLSYSHCILADDRLAVQPALTQVRRADLDVFTLEVEVERPIFVLRQGQGDTTLVMRITVDKDVTAVVWKASKLPPPKYYPIGTNGYEGVDYDTDGNLILWMGSEGATIRDQNLHEVYLENTCFRVAPDGAIVSQISGTMFDRYSPSYSNTSGMSMLRAILWALGRPPAEDLGALEMDDANPDGTRDLRVTGQNSTYSGLGVWNLVVDPANGHLVRKASFGGRGQEPRLKWLSDGTRWFGDIALAQRGEAIHGPPLSYHMAVRLILFKPELDPDVIAKAQEVISRAQTRRVQVYDYRDDPDNPVVKSLQPGDLHKDK